VNQSFELSDTQLIIDQASDKLEFSDKGLMGKLVPFAIVAEDKESPIEEHLPTTTNFTTNNNGDSVFVVAEIDETYEEEEEEEKISSVDLDYKLQAMDFVRGSRIGKGNCGTVWRALNIVDHRMYALKYIYMDEKSNRHQMVKELKAYHSMQCRFLVNFHGAFLDSGATVFALEYMNRGSLQDVLENHFSIGESELKRIAKMVLIALKHMHSKGLVHRDIKPANVLLNRAGQAKVSDFGIVRALGKHEEGAKSFVGTQVYMSPERLENQSYGYPSDIWSFGLMLHALATGEIAYKEREYLALLQLVTKEETPKLPLSKFSSDFVSFLECCLEKDPTKRWTARKLLKHSFLANIDVDTLVPWSWDCIGERDIQDLQEIGAAVGEHVFNGKNLYRRNEQSAAVFSAAADSLSISLVDALPFLERALPLKSLAESPFTR